MTSAKRLSALAVAGVAAAGCAALLAASPAQAATRMPCSAAAKACVDLSTQRAWLAHNGVVYYGPVSAKTGRSSFPTDPGTFHVSYKDLHHVSTETNNAEGSASPMPYSVFFTKSGVAFHGGGSMATRTAGCVRMANASRPPMTKKMNAVTR